MNSSGLHHITAVAGDPQRNYDFYAGLLGLRLVKKTVNFDDPSVYHLYYGDREGNPGTVLTFFPWSRLQKGHPDRGQAVALSFAVPPGALDYWSERLDGEHVGMVEPFERFGRRVMGLQDPDGLHLELAESEEAAGMPGPDNGRVPDEHAVRALQGVTLAEGDPGPTAELLTGVLGYEHAASEGDRHLYLPAGGENSGEHSSVGHGSAVEIIGGAELDGRPGRGTVHHVAFRARDEEHQDQIARALIDRGYHVTDRRDRQYFRSVYFHEPGGVLLEIATDGPGFAIDEEPSQLGGELKLPDWLESKRDTIEADLKELQTL
ncbi:MAG: VOC family protein [Balneolaceae bacterium]|nr:VOC family protein [Balneolaceae bacterium]